MKVKKISKKRKLSFKSMRGMMSYGGYFKRKTLNEKVKKIELAHTAPEEHLNYEIIESMLGKRKARKLYEDTGMTLPKGK